MDNRAEYRLANKMKMINVEPVFISEKQEAEFIQKR
jgi:hypothetical protein